MAEGYDVIVIGTGAGGGTLARHLAPSGMEPSISAVNPALTAMANAMRVGDHLLARLG
jgi:choline dehydrogenase-like flavoprotein